MPRTEVPFHCMPMRCGRQSTRGRLWMVETTPFSAEWEQENCERGVGGEHRQADSPTSVFSGRSV